MGSVHPEPAAQHADESGEWSLHPDKSMADDHHWIIGILHFGRKTAEFLILNQIHEKGFGHVVGMMAVGHLLNTLLLDDLRNRSSPQTRTERTYVFLRGGPVKPQTFFRYSTFKAAQNSRSTAVSYSPIFDMQGR